MKQLPKEDSKKLDKLMNHLQEAAETFLGYPCNRTFDYSALYPFLGLPINNVGDPFMPSVFGLNTHALEREVLDIFKSYTHAPSDSFWGYITNGGTEGNMYGIFLARELHPDGMVYYSEDTHYSVNKIMRVLHARNIMIKSQSNGEMDYDDLYETVRIHRDVPPIIFANIGTTMKGAVDNLDKIRGIMKRLAIPRYYIHADAALSGMILPFVDHPQPCDFRAGIDSISISGHKMIGSPIPCGVVLAKKGNVERIARSVEYIGTFDTTLTGSRNAVTPLFLWYAFKSTGREGFRNIIAECIENADYAIDKMSHFGIDAWRNYNSITVVFPRPGAALVSKWQLAVQQKIAHIITMPHVTRKQIDRFVAELAADLIDTDHADHKKSNRQ
ncbi:MAG: histidine decarboxylase [Gammaproteobacteria bacterium]|nr:histidine decarboxylase [Gammaproteobacteria bacterium]